MVSYLISQINFKWCYEWLIIQIMQIVAQLIRRIQKKKKVFFKKYGVSFSVATVTNFYFFPILINPMFF